jgi:SAM-dependent methyltransferase
MTTPRPPEHLLNRIANNPSFDDFVGSFIPLAGEIKNLLAKANLSFNDFNQILDLGCGVGRFMFAFQPELRPGQQLFGCDVFQECADWCAANIPFAQVTNNSIEPPLPYGHNQFDFVYALSVFTHLRLDMQFRWAQEIFRVIRPGGIFFLTLHGPYFFPMFYEASSNRRAEIHTFGDDALFAYLDINTPPPPDPAQAPTTAQAPNPAQQQTQAKGQDQDQDQGQVQVSSAHTLNFAKTIFTPFEVLLRVPQSRLAGGQDTFILRKPADAKPLALPTNTARGDRWNSHDQPLRDPQPITLTYRLNGQKTFRVYPAADPFGIYSLICDIEIKDAQNTVLARASEPFNNNRIFGLSHHANMELAIPPHEGEVKVTLIARAPNPAELPGSQPPAPDDPSPRPNPFVRWQFPFFA